jgi:hypothetical protein
MCQQIYPNRTEILKKMCRERYIIKNRSEIRELLALSGTGPVKCVKVALLVVGYDGHEGGGRDHVGHFVVKAELSI